MIPLRFTKKFKIVMILRNLSKKIYESVFAVAAAMLTVGCNYVIDEPVKCPSVLKVRFKYDWNIKFADAFTHEVNSVNVWAFDKEGNLVWSDSASGDELKQEGFELDTGLGEGTYDFVSWCGLKGNDCFDLNTYTPTSKEELEVKLKTLQDGGENISKKRLSPLFHGMMNEQEYIIDPYKATYKYVTIPLMKDTKDIRIMLQHLDGSPIEDQDFTVTITANNGWFSWNNNLLPNSPLVTYSPWNIKYGQTSPADGKGPDSQVKAATTVASLMFELSTSRLMADADVRLTIHRNRDNRNIVDNINLIEFLLLVMGHYDGLSDQEYLDYQDDYSMIFFIDQNSNWYAAAGLFINNWAVVPPQHEKV